MFFADLTRAYRDGDLPPAPAAALPGPETPEEDLAYWRAVMADMPEPLELPGSNGSAVPTGWRSGRVDVRLPAHTAVALAELARTVGATLHMALLAAFGVLMHRYTHSDDFLVAAPCSQPRCADRGHHRLLRQYRRHAAAAVPDDDLPEMLEHTRDVAVGAFSHQRVNLDRVVRELNVDRRHGAERQTRVSFDSASPTAAASARRASAAGAPNCAATSPNCRWA